jgi:hypothetical protein
MDTNNFGFIMIWVGIVLSVILTLVVLITKRLARKGYVHVGDEETMIA